MKSPRFSICICTTNRFDELRRAVASVLRCGYNNYEIIISDDAREERVARWVLGLGLPKVKYVKGPGVGLGRNRQNALREAEGEYVIFLDDDAVMARGFLDVIDEYVRRYPGAIITGYEVRDGVEVLPPGFSFLGYMSAKPRWDDLEMVVMNAAAFPREALTRIPFDPRLIYGYDEADVVARLKAAGFRVVFCPEAFNYHIPSARARDGRKALAEGARLYVTAKRYFAVRRSYLKGLIFLLVAPAHLAWTVFRRVFICRDAEAYVDLVLILRSSLRMACSALSEHAFRLGGEG